MTVVDPDQFLGLASRGEEIADAILMPLPLERTVSYGTGTCRGPRAILDASCQVELFDEETTVDFAEAPALHTLSPLVVPGSLREYLDEVTRLASPFREKFVLGLGGEHTLTFGLTTGLAADLEELTIVQIDAHADLIDELEGRRWSHGTVMRRLWERGCRIVQVGVRSLSRAEFELANQDERITTYFAHHLSSRWPELLQCLRGLTGRVYLTVDVDGLDPSVVPSTGTPQPNGLNWTQAMAIFSAVCRAPGSRLIGADVVEHVASPHPPGCDLTTARLVAKILAFWWVGVQEPRGEAGEGMSKPE